MNTPKIAIIDYKMCNLFSVEHACRFAGGNPEITSDVQIINSSDAVILPGVGAFKDAMANIHQLKLDIALESAIAKNKPILGICLGFQLLFSSSEEFGKTEGLGILKGCVKRFPKEHEGNRLKVPQIGWNNIEICRDVPILSGIRQGEYMYFVHSYYVAPADDTLIVTTTNYNGFQYCSSVMAGTIFACQFHPEKSAREGVKIYNNWISSIS
jgi:glutamine amidotransferase